MNFVLILFFTNFPVNPIGVPLIENYSTIAVSGDSQTWSFVQGKDGRLFFGNSNGLIAYDGSRWRLLRMDNSSILRTLATDGSDLIYFGAEGDFGYVTPDPEKYWEKVSFRDRFPPEIDNKPAIWNIFPTGDGVYFVSTSCIYLYHPDQDRLEWFLSSDDLKTSGIVDGRLHVWASGKGLLRLQEGKLVLADQGDFFSDKRIYVYLPFSEGTWLLGTETDGLYLYRPGEPEPVSRFEASVNQFLSTNELYRGICLNEDLFVLGTINRGLIFMDRKGEILLHLDKDRGLADDSVFGLGLDRNNHLWVTTNNGISMVDFQNPISHFPEPMGIPASALVAAFYKDQLYLGTYRGVVYHSWEPPHCTPDQSGKFQKVENFVASAWDLLEFDGELLAGGRFGVQSILNGRAEPIFKMEAPVFNLLQPRDQPQKLLLGARDGLYLAEKGQGQWKLHPPYPELNESLFFLEQAPDGALWSVYPGRKLVRMELSPDCSHILSKITFGVADGLPQDSGNRPFYLREQLLIGTSQGFYNYDATQPGFFPMTELNQLIGADREILQVCEIENGEIWIQFRRAENRNGGDETLLARIQNYPQNPGITSNGTRLLSGMTFNDIQSVNQGRQVLFLAPEAVYAYNYEIENTNPSMFSACITSIRDPDSDRPLYFPIPNRPARDAIRFPPQQNALRFVFGQDFHAYLSGVSYQFYLSGFDQDWLPWTEANHRDYTNLPPGRYKLHLRVRNHSGIISQPTILPLEIGSFFYQTLWFRSFLILFLAALIWMGHRLATRLLVKRALNLEKQVVERTRSLEKVQDQLLESARLAGMADVAASVMHDVGNTLNSVRTSLTLVKETLTGSKLSGIVKANRLLAELLADPNAPQAKKEKLLTYYNRLEQFYSLEQNLVSGQLARLEELVRVLNNVLDSQEDLASSLSFSRPVNLAELIDEVIVLRTGLFQGHKIEVQKKKVTPHILKVDKLRLLHVLIVLIENAVEAMADSAATPRVLTITMDREQEGVRLQLIDNGCGIESTNFPNLFRAGFSTKPGRSGMNLHRSANFIREMKGKLSLHNNPNGQGICATLWLSGSEED